MNIAPDPNDAWRNSPQLDVLCELPDGPIRVLQCRGGVLYAETDKAFYQILENGSYIGVQKGEPLQRIHHVTDGQLWRDHESEDWIVHHVALGMAYLRRQGSSEINPPMMRCQVGYLLNPTSGWQFIV